MLKIDIEGLECCVLDKMINDKIFPTYLSVDFDLGWNGERIRDIQTCKNTINKLLKIGYKILHFNNSDYSFIYSVKKI